MRSITLANEKTRSFNARLKRSYLFGWYRAKLNQPTSRKRLSSSQRQGRFKIDQIAFFRKHFWYHFYQNAVTGWIPVKHFRKNYCRLNLHLYKGKVRVNPELASLIEMCRYVRPQVNVAKMIRQYRQIRPRTVDQLFPVVVDQVGRFKNVSRKSMRRLRHQIWHQLPVVMAIMLNHRARFIIVVGFNRRVFTYLIPGSDQLRLITRKRLIKAWQRCGYRAVSC